MLKVHMPARLIRAYRDSRKVDGSQDSTYCFEESRRVAVLTISTQSAGKKRAVPGVAQMNEGTWMRSV